MSATSISALKTRSAESVLVVKTVVGEVVPVYTDSLKLCREIFCGEQCMPEEKVVDSRDAVCIHIVAYLNETARKHYQEQEKVSERLNHTTGSPVRFRKITLEEAEKASGLPYKAPTLIPVGTMRLRRSASCSKLGKLNMMVAEAGHLCVKPEYRRYGVGEALMAEAEKVAQSVFHVPYIMLHAQLSTMKFYEKLGFSSKSETFTDGGIQYVVMVKEVSGNSRGKL